MIVLVTGGSAGIGHAIVEHLAAGGHQVFAAARRPERNPLPDGVTPVNLDVASAESARAAVDVVVRAAGGIDALVNNAGTGGGGPLEEVDDDEARHVFEVNFFGPLRLARLVTPIMRSRGGGRIVNVSSMNDVLVSPFGGIYSASKAALTSASYALRAELSSFGIRVTVVAPGLFRTEMAAALGQDRRPDPSSPYHAALQGLRGQDEGRLDAAGDPDEVAVAVEDCLVNADPPARIVVGADAVNYEKLVRESSVEDFNAMLRDFVAQLEAAGRDS